MSDLYKVTTVFTGVEGLPGTNTLHGDAGLSSADDFITIVGEFWEAMCTNGGSGSSGLFNTLVATTLGVCDVIDSTTGLVTGTDGHGDDIVNHGNGTGEIMPFATQGLMQIRTGAYFGGRELRGRFFVPALTQDHNGNGRVASTALDAWNPAGTILAESALAVYSPSKHQWASARTCSAWAEFAVLRSRRD